MAVTVGVNDEFLAEFSHSMILVGIKEFSEYCDWLSVHKGIT